MGHAGIVLGLEVSRLARNNADWHRLLELAAMSHTLILDEDGVYDPAHFNDRLLLGLKGTMSEAELHILKSRLQGGILNKARRGELEMPLPIGLVYTADGRVVLDPDRQIQDTVRLLFETFRETGSACAVVRRMRGQKILFPRRIRRGIGKGDVLWSAIDHSRVLQILHNPRYAGAFVYGRNRNAYNAKLKPVQRRVPKSDWQVLIPDAHEGYISWAEFERNQVDARAQRQRFVAGAARSHAAPGRRVAAGSRCCAVAAARACACTTSCWMVGCARTTSATRRSCAMPASTASGSRGTAVDEAVERAAAARRWRRRRSRWRWPCSRRSRSACEQAAALRAGAVAARSLRGRTGAPALPEGRSGEPAGGRRAGSRLERAAAPTRCTAARARASARRPTGRLLDEAARERITALASDFPRVWNDERTSAVERKRMLALLIEDVTLFVGEQIDVHVRWRGGRTQSLSVPRPRPMSRRSARRRRRSSQLIDELLETSTDRQIAAAAQRARPSQLARRALHDEEGHRSCAATYSLKSRFERLRERGMLTGEEVARQLGVSTTTVHQLGRQGVLARHLYGNNHRCLYEPPGNVRLAQGRRQPIRRPTASAYRRSTIRTRCIMKSTPWSARGTAGTAAA